MEPFTGFVYYQAGFFIFVLMTNRIPWFYYLYGDRFGFLVSGLSCCRSCRNIEEMQAQLWSGVALGGTGAYFPGCLEFF